MVVLLGVLRQLHEQSIGLADEHIDTTLFITLISVCTLMCCVGISV